MEGEKPKLYGDGKNVHEWVNVRDHSDAVWKILTQGKSGERYLIGSDCEIPNIDVVHEILKAFGKDEDYIDWAPDRLGHDRRYAIDSSKLRTELAWQPEHFDFAEGLIETIQWYKENKFY